MAKTYIPQPGTLPSRVVRFFETNPGEEMSRDDIAAKFEVRPGNIHTQLARCLEESLLTRTRNDDGDYIYRIGTRSCKPSDGGPVPTDAATTPPPAPPAAPPATGQQATLAKYPGIVIDTDLPIPHGKQLTDWTPLLRTLKPGNSFVVGLTDRYSVEKNIRSEHKAKRGKYTVRKYADSKTLRVWCIKEFRS